METLVQHVLGLMIKGVFKHFKYFLNYKDNMGSPWKASSDDNRRQIILLP